MCPYASDDSLLSLPDAGSRVSAMISLASIIAWLSSQCSRCMGFAIYVVVPSYAQVPIEINQLRAAFAQKQLHRLQLSGHFVGGSEYLNLGSANMVFFDINRSEERS